MPEASASDAFCASCGQQLPADARFCPACGQQNEASRRKHVPARAAAVFAVLAAVGAFGLYTVVREPATQRAVPGAPGAPATAAAPSGAPGMPADHPSIELPQEVVKFIDDLAAAATAAPQDVEAWKKLARARYRAGMLNRKYNEQALQAVNHVLELVPNDTEAIRMAANIAYEGERFAEAEKLFGRYLELDPKDPGVRTDRASAILFQGRTEEARKLYADIIATNPDFVQAHVNLGITLHSEGKREEAMASFKRARELAKDPEQREHVERIITAAEARAEGGRATAASAPGGPSGAAPGTEGAAAGSASASGDGVSASGGGTAAAGSAAPASPASDASTDFQRDVDRVFAAHPIVAPKIARIEWKDASHGAVRLRAFPMDQMPPVVRNKFKSTTNEKIAALSRQHAVAGDVRIELVDDQSGRVMDSLDGKELIGAFDPQDQ
jgi:Flp pilus assembly protein TadD